MAQTIVQIQSGQTVQLTENVGQFKIGTIGKVLEISSPTCKVEVEDWEGVLVDLNLTTSQVQISGLTSDGEDF